MPGSLLQPLRHPADPGLGGCRLATGVGGRTRPPLRSCSRDGPGPPTGSAGPTCPARRTSAP